MLGTGYRTIGIACFEEDGVKYWVQEFASNQSGTAAFPANDAPATVTVNWKEGTDSRFTYKIYYDLNNGDGIYTRQEKPYDVDITLRTITPRRANGKSEGYTVRFDATGGKTRDESLTAETIIRYSFKCWNTKADGTGRSYAPGDQYSQNANMTLYAQWSSDDIPGTIYIPDATREKKITEGYTIRFNAMGGKTRDESLTTENTICYTFEGWNTKADGTGKSYVPGDQYSQKKDLTLYAQWSSKTISDSFYLPDATRNGYRFLGWSLDRSASSVDMEEGTIYTPEKSITLYAVWIPTYQIIYNMNGSAQENWKQEKQKGETAELFSSIPGRQEEDAGKITVICDLNTGHPDFDLSQKSVSAFRNYTFLDWNTKADGSGKSYKPGASYNTDEDLTLYAQWNCEIIANQAVYLSNPTWTDHIFLGWAAQNNASAAEYEPDSYFSPSGDITLYGIWKARTYTITFHANGGANAPARQTKIYGEPLILSSQIPERSGYRFLGWAETEDASVVSYSPGSKYYQDQAIHLYAVWISTSTSPTNPVPSDNIANFVLRCYTRGLGRDEGSVRVNDEDGLRYWYDILKTKQLTCQQVGTYFATSPEASLKYTGNAEFVAMLYKLYMEDRDYDQGGYIYWVGLLDREILTRGQVNDYFGISDEFRAIVASYGL